MSFDFTISASAAGAVAVTEQVVAGLAKVESKAAQTSKAMDTIGLNFERATSPIREHLGDLAGKLSDTGSVIDDLKGNLVSMIGPAALATAAISAIGEEMDRMARHRERLIDASNALLKFYDTAEQANSALGEQEQLSNDLHLSLGKTVEAYAAVREATEELHLTSGQMVDVTRNLTAALVIDGKSAGDVAGVMNRFQVAMELGTLTGKDYKSILRESKDVAELLANSIHKTVAEVQAMANEGKITKGVMGEMVRGIGDADQVMAKLSQRTLTMKGVMEEMDLGFADAIVYIQKAQEGFKKAEISVAEFSLRIIKLNTEIIPDLIKNLKGITAQGIIDANVAATKKIVEGFLSDKKHAEEAAKAAEKAAAAYKALADVRKLIFGEGPVDQFGLRGEKGAFAAHEREQANLKAQQEVEDRAGGFGSEVDASIRALPGQDPLADLIAAQEKVDEGTKKIREQTRAWNKELQQVGATEQAVADALTSAAASFGDTLVDAANGADVSWKKFGEDLIVMFEKAIVKALILEAIGSATGGVGGAGAGILGAIFGGNHADGGSFTAPNTGGGVDSVPVMFRMNPGETAHFTNPGQQASNVSVAAPTVTVITGDDRRALRSGFHGPEGDSLFVDLARRNRHALRDLSR